MGIKFFYGWFKKKFGNCINKSSTLSNKILCLDLNGIIHSSYGKLFENSFFEKIPNKLIYDEIYNKIQDLINITQSDYVCVFIDGVAPLNKQRNQRERRWTTDYMYDLNYDKILFNSNCISPGTKFMTNLDIFLNDKFKDDEKVLHFSPSNIEGEGEHKIIDYILTSFKKCDNYIIYSNDADVILLSMVLVKKTNKNIEILREDANSSCFININNATSLLYKFVLNKDFCDTLVDRYNRDKIIDEFLFLSFFVGNDFLPKINYLVTGRYLDFVINFLTSNGSNILTFEEDYIIINSENFIQFLKYFKKELIIMIQINHKNILKFNKENVDTLILSNLYDGKFDYNKYILEYEKSCNFSDINQVSEDYLKSMCWIYNYYNHKSVDWGWYYKHLFSPSIDSIINNIDENNDFSKKIISPKTNLDKFIHNNSTLQLMYILPKTSLNILSNHINTKLFYKKFKLILNSKVVYNKTGKSPYEYIKILPDIKHNDLIDFLNLSYENCY